MSTAVCLQCGARKHGALVPCEGCGHAPVDLDDRARHLVVAEDLAPGAIAALSAHIAAGGAPPEVDPEVLADVRDRLEEATPLRVAVFALLAGGVPFLLILGGLLVVAWLVASV